MTTFDTLLAARDAVRSKAVSSVELTKHALARIEAVEPAVEAFLGTFPDRALEPFRAPYDATVARKLEAAGAIIVGKTNLDEFAMGSSTENSAFKPTRNPWDLERIPGGSSGGSAAALAAGMCVASIGSDTGGSIRQPAGLCGLVGLKPTYGHVALPTTEYGIAAYYIIAPCEASSNLARYDGVHYGHRTKEPVADIIEMFSKSRAEGFGIEVKRRIMIGTYALSSGYYDAYYVRALKIRALIKREFDEAFKKCDVILCPTSPVPAFKIGEKTGDPLQMYLTDVFTVTANIAGIPGLSLPCGFTIGEKPLPIGLQLLAPSFAEEKLLRI